MKKLFLLLLIFSSNAIFAQAPKGMVQISMAENRANEIKESLYNGKFSEKVKKASAEAVNETNAYLDSVENKYSIASEEGRRLTNEEYANQLAAIHKYIEKDLGKIRQIYLPVMLKVDFPETNDPVLNEFIEEFKDGARHYRVNYIEKFQKIKKVVYVENNNLGFIGTVEGKGTEIHLNSELKQFPNLARVIFFNQIGEIYGLKERKDGRDFMSNNWFIDSDHEGYAIQHRKRRNQRDRFFKALEEKHPLDKKI